jgi:iron only hydrogenase large subunit-like protein
MENCLQTKKSNCKNCYKCIRHCPVKSIKFTDGQAHIIRDECILCGECYVVCPQDAKMIRNDIGVAKQLISSGQDVYVSLAPSFVAAYPDKSTADMKAALIKLGFKGVGETAIGAAIVKKEFENLIKSRKSNIIISSCCHSLNSLIQRHYKEAIPYLANVISPMQAHTNEIKKEHKDCKVVFIGPCISKKAEAEKYGGPDCVLTFDELDKWLVDENITIEGGFSDCEKGRTRMFPTSGGIIGSMDKDPEFNYIAVDGLRNCINALEDIDKGELKNCFIEMSTCSGSCISGPVMKRRKLSPIKSLVSVKNITGTEDFKVEMPEEKELKKVFAFEGLSKIMPGSAAVEEILKKMGKNSKEKELNCGSCGYNTCREKAVAVLMGKADLTMCLPFLKDKAENFSDIIINNSPNGIIVLDEQLNIQQINKAAGEILNLQNTTAVAGIPVFRILEPIDYILTLNSGKNVYDNHKYLAQCQKYIEETIIYDKEYKILMILMKDISEEEKIRSQKEKQSKAAIEITDKVIEKQMRVVQEMASILGETTAETQIALTKLKETFKNE